MVTLPPMPEDVWDAWCAASIRGYASDMVRVGTWPAEGAEARAESRFARVVPAGRATAGHEFRSIMNDAGETVGALWFAPDGENGRAAREALEAFVGALGYDAIRLHVFGDNDAAHHLYRSVGYSETDVSMVKRLA
jgi:ribosomal protein S18 acetylase RimI-like enzyme